MNYDGTNTTYQSMAQVKAAIVGAYRISLTRMVLPNLLLISIVYGRNTRRHELPDERVPGGTWVDLDAVVTGEIVVAEEVAENALVLSYTHSNDKRQLWFVLKHEMCRDIPGKHSGSPGLH